MISGEAFKAAEGHVHEWRRDSVPEGYCCTVGGGKCDHPSVVACALKVCFAGRCEHHLATQPQYQPEVTNGER